jgi:hypothetical protein
MNPTKHLVDRLKSSSLQRPKAPVSYKNLETKNEKSTIHIYTCRNIRIRFYSRNVNQSFLISTYNNSSKIFVLFTFFMSMGRGCL